MKKPKCFLCKDVGFVRIPDPGVPRRLRPVACGCAAGKRWAAKVAKALRDQNP